MSSVAALLYCGAVALNLTFGAVCLWRAWRVGLFSAKPKVAARPTLTLSGGTVSISLLAHPSTRPEEIDDAVRFGLAAMQKYLDGLAAEKEVRHG